MKTTYNLYHFHTANNFPGILESFTNKTKAITAMKNYVKRMEWQKMSGLIRKESERIEIVFNAGTDKQWGMAVYVEQETPDYTDFVISYEDNERLKS